MKNASLDKYLEDRGINVIWNTLGHTDDLIRAYVSDTHPMVDASPSKQSHFSKGGCYKLFYEMPERIKKTGFEEFDSQAMQIKTELCASIPQGGTPSKFFDTPEPGSTGFKETLKKTLADLPGEKFLYLSGGIDSELVAMALVDAGVEFTPVIFNWVDNSGEYKNSYETNFAYDFCQRNHLTPMEKTVNIEALWATPEFKKLAEDVQLISAHLITHVYMVEMIAGEFPGRTHLFGGEVRYTSSSLQEDGSLSNIVLLDKTTPGYNGLTYSVTSSNPLLAATVRLTMETTTFTWTISRLSGTSGPTGTITGSWHTGAADPSGYEFSITNVVDNLGDGSSIATPSAATGYSNIGTTTTEICRVNMPGSSSTTGSYTFTIRTRSKTALGFLDSTITLQATN